MHLRRLALAVTLTLLAAAHTAAAEPVPLVFDTDMGNDVDDVLALGMIHALEARGACRLLAVTLTKDHELAAPFVDAIDTFYGRGDVPIGVVRGGVTPEIGRFLPLTRERDAGALRYPHDLSSGADAPEATDLLRRTLAAGEDGSVVVVQVGFSTNLARLLASGPDAHSALTGRDLVERKVRLLSVMAGAFQPIGGETHLEYNVIKDVPSAKALVRDWPTPVVWSGFEIGIALPYPSESIERDYGYVEHHPLAEAYRLYKPPPHDRPTWDLTAVLHAAFPERGYFSLSPPGRVTVEDDGETRFVEDAGGRDRYLILDPQHRAAVTEALVYLSSQPPPTPGLEGVLGR